MPPVSNGACPVVLTDIHWTNPEGTVWVRSQARQKTRSCSAWSHVHTPSHRRRCLIMDSVTTAQQCRHLEWCTVPTGEHTLGLSWIISTSRPVHLW